MFLHGPDKKLTHFALGLRKHDLRILVGLLTGHCTLKHVVYSVYLLELFYSFDPGFMHTKTLSASHSVIFYVS